MDETVITVLAAEEDGELVILLIVENDEGALADFEIDDGLVWVEGADLVGLLVDVGGRDVLLLALVDGFLVNDVLLDVADGAVFARAMALEQPGFELPHAAGDLVDALVDGGIDVLGGGLHFDDDVVGAEENDFGHQIGRAHV